MYLLENPVLQRELLVNLRMLRGFVLLFFYVAALGAVVYVAWPTNQRLDLTTSPEEARQLVNLFFLGQYVLLALMAPSFAAGTITGEKERRTYEMLLASPLRPGAIVTGKTAGLLEPPGGAGVRLAADRDALPAAGRRVALRGAGHLRGDGRFGGHIRHDLRHGQQLLHPHHRGAGGFLSADSADGARRRAVLSAV